MSSGHQFRWWKVLGITGDKCFSYAEIASVGHVITVSVRITRGASSKLVALSVVLQNFSVN